MKLPAVVAFDVNETLSDTAALGAAFDAEGLPPGDAPLWFARILRDAFALTVTGNRPSFADLARAQLPAGLDPAAVERLVGAFARLPLHPDVAPGLRALARTGVRIVTLTNGAAEVSRTLLESGGLADVVTEFLSVEEAPAWKPAASSYHWAAARCDVAIADLMLVAVHPWDIAGAEAAGARTAWINRTGVSYPPVFAPAEMTVASITDLAERLGKSPQE